MYSSCHRILLVGEGDFSFSLSLAQAFASASNIFATSLDSYENLMKKYARARSNLEELEMLGATLLHKVDATKMKDHCLLKLYKFDRIVFNFPHAGFFGKEGNPEMIKMHKSLVRGFFSNARWLLHDKGEIHVSHKTSLPYSYWNLEGLASESSLTLTQRVPFNRAAYPYYEQKRGQGALSDKPFELGACATFKFAHSPPPSAEPFNDESLLGLNSVRPKETVDIKFIVRAAVDVNSRAAGYAGVLVDQKEGVFGAFFYGPMLGVLDSHLATLVAIRQALSMVERSGGGLCRRKPVVVESDSTRAVSWILSDFGNPPELQPLLSEISMALGRIQNVKVEYGCNEVGGVRKHFVDRLAERGLYVNKLYEAWL